ncbi:hypothetical protein M3D75_06055 [Microbacterium enclense]|nr:hypothetical protein [Microbacterium enclense]
MLCRYGYPATVALEPGHVFDRATVLDLHVRNSGPSAAIQIHDGLHREHVDYVKIDSQLRGPVRLLVQAASEYSVVVFAPALPHLQRTVHRGKLLIDGAPLRVSSTSAWKTESGTAPHRLVDVVPPFLPARHFSVAAVRSGEFARELSTGQRGEVFIPDTHSDGDMRAIANAITATPHVVTPVGSAGLLEAIVANAERPQLRYKPNAGTARKVVLVLGSLEPVVASQRAALKVDSTTVVVRSDLEEASLTALIADALQRPPRVIVVMTEASSGPHDVSVAQRIGQATAAAVRHDSQVAMALIGGETARQTLQSAGDNLLEVVGEVHPGAVLSITASGRRVVTRPGSFGAVDSLHQIITTLLGDAPRDRQEEGTQ